MCGIIGYVGPREASEVLITGLRRLEYRGYDSAGIAIIPKADVSRLHVIKRKGTLREGLEAMLSEEAAPASNLGVGHTRWATHGVPSDVNAHPHTDEAGRIAVVHNGIIENYATLGAELRAKGQHFRSDVDSEVIPHLLASHKQSGLSLLEATLRVMDELRGAFALGIVDADESDTLLGVRKDSPLVVGLGDGEQFLASDVAALLPYTRDVILLENGDVALLQRDGVQVFDRSGTPTDRPVTRVDWDAEMAEKGGYAHFMIKEIEEQPFAWRAALSGRIETDRIQLPEIQLQAEVIQTFQQAYLIGCGTSYHAAVAAIPLFERYLDIPVRAEVASEFRYREPQLDDRVLTVFISQSGETADTLACLELALEKGACTMSITNVVGSSLARKSQDVLYTRAGPEVSVASTKTYTTQLLLLQLAACELGLRKGSTGRYTDEIADLLNGMQSLAPQAETLLEDHSAVRRTAEYLAKWDDSFFIGRGLDYAAALEGQLKLKEISYIHAEAYPAGELKHGTLALIEKGVPVVALSTQGHLREKMLSNVQEVRARGAWTCLVTNVEDLAAESGIDQCLMIPETHPHLMPLLLGVQLQLLAYYTAVLRDCPVDMPRNLAKSVTVE